MYKKLKRCLLTVLSVFMTFTTVLQWDVSKLKANEELIESLLPEVSGVPKIWTNKMIQLTIERNDNDYMYSFSDKEGYYHWQKDPISKSYGQNQVVYVSVMNQDGSISKERKVELTKLDLFQPEVNVTFE